ncbi:MAG TPA: hypothetical protein VKT83_14280 [bacterium]|nr:hypothetical protein [bacterium]
MVRSARQLVARFEPVGHLALPGGGQIVVDGAYAYVGHMAPPHGTSILDVADPANPRVLARLTVPDDIHSHKVRVAGDVMLVNYERYPEGDLSRTPDVGLKIFDIADRRRPREIAFFRTAGRGVHRFDLQGTHAFLSTEWPGFRSNILLILDVADPARPAVAGRWSFAGQEASASPEPLPVDHWVHLALARGNRAYAACGHAGVMIVDISDVSRPRTVSAVAWDPPYVNPTHTFLPVPHLIRGRRFAVVTDEDVTDDVLEDPPAFMWVLDITEETRSVPVATYQVEPDGLVVPGQRFGAHQPWEHIREDNIVFLAWFSGGVRAVDISDPYRPREAAAYVPPAGAGRPAAQTNDIFVDRRGFVYAIDRYEGLSVLEFRRSD